MSRGGWPNRTEPDPELVLAALGNKYAPEILCATDTPVTAQTLSREIDIPIATCYRRIDELVDAGLLECEGRELSEEGRRSNIYRRTIDRVDVQFSTGSPTFSYDRRTEAKNELQDKLEL